MKKEGRINSWNIGNRPGLSWSAAAVLALALTGAGASPSGPVVPVSKNEYNRIVSLSPSTTEILFALNIGDRVVGRTRFCNYPPPAARIPSVGGFLDPNYEAVRALNPDIVIILPEHESVIQYLDQLGINHFTVNNKRIADIMSAIRIIGDRFGASERAAALIDSMAGVIRYIEKRSQGRRRPSVLISIGRTLGTGSLGEVFVAGKDTYYDELLNLAGGVNACGDQMLRYPQLSLEGIISLNPDMIIELIPDLDERGVTEAEVRKDWEAAAPVTAVKRGEIHILRGDYVQIPGPRFISLLRDLADILHPEER